MPRALYADGAEVDGQYIEGCFGAALHGCGQQGSKAVDAMCAHGLDQ